MPQLLLEEKLAKKDRELRDGFYGGIFGLFYGFLMPFLTLPARPLKSSLTGWLVYAVLLAFFLFVIILFVLNFGPQSTSLSSNVTFLIIFVCGTLIFKRYKYLFFLFLLAVPVKVSLTFRRFTPEESFTMIHQRIIAELTERAGKLKVLDVSTGSCSSLYKHGWMKLNADYVGIDLSETMLGRGLNFMAEKNVPIELAFADATNLPFQSETFDLVLSYGAVNGISDPSLALREMVRVAKSGAVLLFLDEQLYRGASVLEAMYFKRVLSSHNVIHECPVEYLPSNLIDIKVHQVYEFYYICTALKA